MSAHTPGPWFRGAREENAIVSGSEQGLVVGRLLGFHKTDARLIAAAPELLEALIVAEAFISIAVPEKAIDRDEAIYEVIPKVRAALRKATEA
jgi:hypothetical protein